MARQQRRTLGETLGDVTGQGASTPTAPAPAAEVEAPAPKAGQAETKRASLYLPKAAHRQLRELAFTHDRAMHDYLLEGVDMVFAKYGMPSIADLTGEKK